MQVDGGGVHRGGATAVPEGGGEEPAEWAVGGRRLGVLLAALLRYAYGGADGEAE